MAGAGHVIRELVTKCRDEGERGDKTIRGEIGRALLAAVCAATIRKVFGGNLDG